MGLCEQHKRHCLFQNFNDSISWQSGFHTGFSYLKTQTSLRLSSIDKLVLSVNTTSVLSPWVANWSNFDHVRSTVEANLYTTSMRRCLFNKTVFFKKIFLLWLKKNVMAEYSLLEDNHFFQVMVILKKVWIKYCCSLFS